MSRATLGFVGAVQGAKAREGRVGEGGREGWSEGRLASGVPLTVGIEMSH